MRTVHDRLRGALQIARTAVTSYDEPTVVGRDLLLTCRGFCTALDAHHRGEDLLLFPALAEQHPELQPALEKLRQDHRMIAHLLQGLAEAVEEAPSRPELERHLDGIGAIMESHFRYEERTLLSVLETLDLTATAEEVFGPL